MLITRNLIVLCRLGPLGEQTSQLFVTAYSVSGQIVDSWPRFVARYSLIDAKLGFR